MIILQKLKEFFASAGRFMDISFRKQMLYSSLGACTVSHTSHDQPLTVVTFQRKEPWEARALRASSGRKTNNMQALGSWELGWAFYIQIKLRQRQERVCISEGFLWRIKADAKLGLWPHSLILALLEVEAGGSGVYDVPQLLGEHRAKHCLDPTPNPPK